MNYFIFMNQLFCMYRICLNDYKFLAKNSKITATRIRANYLHFDISFFENSPAFYSNKNGIENKFVMNKNYIKSNFTNGFDKNIIYPHILKFSRNLMQKNMIKSKFKQLNTDMYRQKSIFSGFHNLLKCNFSTSSDEKTGTSSVMKDSNFSEINTDNKVLRNTIYIQSQLGRMQFYLDIFLDLECEVLLYTIEQTIKIMKDYLSILKIDQSSRMWYHLDKENIHDSCLSIINETIVMIDNVLCASVNPDRDINIYKEFASVVQNKQKLIAEKLEDIKSLYQNFQ